MAEVQHAVEARFGSVRGLLSALQAIKGSARQSCVLEFNSSGMEVRWQDEARMMQSKVGFSTALFEEYRMAQGGRMTVSLPFHLLLDSLAAFASSTASPLDMRFPGPDGELLLEAAEDEGEGTTSTSSYARISTQEMVAPLTDLAEGWEQPQSYFIAQGSLLKEVIDDLEWTGGEVIIVMQRNSPDLRFYSTKQSNSLEIQVPFQHLIGFEMSQPELRWTYKYKQLKAAFTHIPLKDGAAVSTKVAIDANGMMGVVHLLTMQTAAQEPQAVSHPLATFSSQATVMNTSRRTAVNWVLLPHDDEATEDEDLGRQGEEVL